MTREMQLGGIVAIDMGEGVNMRLVQNVWRLDPDVVAEMVQHVVIKLHRCVRFARVLHCRQ